jgi:hypothetical protein
MQSIDLWHGELLVIQKALRERISVFDLIIIEEEKNLINSSLEKINKAIEDNQNKMAMPFDEMVAKLPIEEKEAIETLTQELMTEYLDSQKNAIEDNQNAIN